VADTGTAVAVGTACVVAGATGVAGAAFGVTAPDSVGVVVPDNVLDSITAAAAAKVRRVPFRGPVNAAANAASLCSDSDGPSARSPTPGCHRKSVM
jgi:hypothetical protein